MSSKIFIKTILTIGYLCMHKSQVNTDFINKLKTQFKLAVIYNKLPIYLRGVNLDPLVAPIPGLPCVQTTLVGT